ncbi:MAG: MarR family transcriptional regulator [Ramlibacter sp.]|jgi:DNA-binding MarR family transcriptional regulator|nr:MarR family transcriptional regulator [Ramlibacter sp.]
MDRTAAPPASVELHEQPGHLIRRAHQIAVSLFHENLGREVTPVQYAVLRALQDQPGIDQVTLAQAIALDTSSTADVAVRLEAKGLIVREVLPRGQRALALTGQGEELLARLVPGMNAMCRDMLADMDRAEQAEFIRLLRKFVHLNDDGRGARAR